MPIDTDPPEFSDDGPTNAGQPTYAAPPPLPEGVSADTKHQHALAEWQTRSVCASIDAHDQNDSRRSRRLARAISKIDDDLDEKAESAGKWRTLIEGGAKEVWSVFKQPLAALALGLGTYWGWKFTGADPTPTPVVIAQPVTITPTAEAATPAPVVTIDPATVED
jgi:hypothetical protein